MKDRSERRKHEQRIKEKLKKRARSYGNRDLDEKDIGKLAAVHGAMCSCHMCGNPRKHFKAKTLQEYKSDIDYTEENFDI